MFRLGKMGVFNFMSLFIIVAIGVDDLYVFFDAWRQSAAHAARGEVDASEWREESMLRTDTQDVWKLAG